MKSNISILFSARIVRLFCYGFLSVVLALYLAKAGLTEQQIGLLFTLTLAGDAGISLWLTTSADRFGRKRTLLLGAFLMMGAGVVFILTRNPLLLMAAAIIGVISPSGNEIGPFLSVEQAGLTQLIPNQRRTQVFAWYNLFILLVLYPSNAISSRQACRLHTRPTPWIDFCHRPSLIHSLS